MMRRNDGGNAMDSTNICTAEFQFSNLGLVHPKPKVFSICQWRGAKRVFVIYRVLLAIYCLVWLVVGGVVKAQELGVKWFIYMTNWSYFLLALRLIVQAYTALSDYRNGGVQGKEPPGQTQQRMGVTLKVQWVLENTSTPSGLTTSLLGLIMFMQDTEEIPLDAVNINMHAINSLIIIVDMFMSCSPVRMLHFYQALLPMLAYIGFSAAYTTGGGTNEKGQEFIYDSLDWLNDPGNATGKSAMATVITLLVWVLHCGRYLVWYSFGPRCIRRLGIRGDEDSSGGKVKERPLSQKPRMMTTTMPMKPPSSLPFPPALPPARPSHGSINLSFQVA